MICGAMEDKNFHVFDEFEKRTKAFDMERKYQPRIVVDDDEDVMSDEDDI